MLIYKKIIWLLLFMVSSFSVTADQVINDDYIVSGLSCVGLDCYGGEAFNGDTLRLKENNTRIRFHDTSITTGFGESWNLEANSSREGATSYFDFQVKSLNADTIRVVTAKDGLVPDYDCSIPLPIDPITEQPVSSGIIPIGQPFIAPELTDPISCSGSPQVCNYICNTVEDFEVESALTFGTANGANPLGNGVAIGSNSDIEVNTVSVGRATLLRRIANVARGINATDILTLERLNDYSAVEDQLAQVAILRQRIASMNLLIDALNQQVTIIDLDDDNDGFSDVDEGICGSISTNSASVPVDFDGDKLCDNGVDPDDDNDLILDVDDAFPLDPTRSCIDFSDPQCVLQTLKYMHEPFCDSIIESETIDGYVIPTPFGSILNIPTPFGSLENIPPNSDLIPLIQRSCDPI